MWEKVKRFDHHFALELINPETGTQPVGELGSTVRLLGTLYNVTSFINPLNTWCCYPHVIHVSYLLREPVVICSLGNVMIHIILNFSAYKMRSLICQYITRFSYPFRSAINQSKTRSLLTKCFIYLLQLFFHGASEWGFSLWSSVIQIRSIAFLLFIYIWLIWSLSEQTLEHGIDNV